MTNAHELAKDRGVPVLIVGRERPGHWNMTLCNTAGGSDGGSWTKTRDAAIRYGSRSLEAGAEFIVLTEHWINSGWRQVGLIRYRKVTPRGTFPMQAVPA